ncbi:AAA family ATPase [uncultured Fibrobacter sp.]|uniref:AAA family ATPase n=1 Tax=uncultured Fibrobacter sp. TaxID=261512 RepID=UPI00262CB302|nr:AAA family ATPase [uncultured Fibrobacter sp.]
MRLSLQTVQRAFDEIAQLGIDNKFWGVLTIVKNVKKYLKLPTSIGTMSLIVCDKNGVQNDLKNFFSLQNTTDNNKQANDDDWLLLRKDFASWVSYELLANKRVNFLSLAVFLFRNTSFQERLTSDLLIQKVKSFLNIPKEWEKDWFKEIASFDIEYEDSFNESWSCDFSVGWRKYKFDKTHGSIVFKPSKDIYSVVAKPDELSRGPFYQPLYAAQGNAILFIKKDFFENVEEIKKTNEDVGEVKKQNNTNSITPSQIIYYGVPGCGKSNKIREQLKDVPEKNKVRVVFHPEYTNAEFIGQILPVTNDGIRYEFTPGPFTQIIKRAYLNPNEQFYLVIEEINRGNAAAIFGDTFQLLDRLKAGETDSLGNDPANASVNTFTEGWSQYFVQNDDVNAYIRGTENSIQIGNIRFDSNTAIRLPPNLSILATMNTSDQNVFTLDNAFQRRFDMELVRNEFDLTKPAVNAQYNAEIDDTGIKWGQFWGWINAKITATLKGLSSTEDKRLGVWFVSNVGGIIDDKVFAEKVLKFLWDDVFKFKRPQVFAEGIDTLEKLINSFEKPSEGKERFDVFKDKANLVAFVASPTL